MTTNNYTKFLNTYSGKRLLEKHSLHERGVWEVRGEDPNCDLGGPHHEPYIGTYTGVLADVITIAVDSGSFWQWGAGGSIKRIDVQPANTKTIIKRRKDLERLTALEAEIALLKKSLNETNHS